MIRCAGFCYSVILQKPQHRAPDDMTILTAGPSDAGNGTHPKYRSDIDGLRAVAIISVVIFHAFPHLLSGGFVGVDIFFVISGFLISSIIFGGLERGTFSFFDFYSRRIKRIFPALLVVLVACYLIGWFVLFADEFKQLGKHIAGGAGFVANLMLWKESGYFDRVSETKPLLHLWSLGIEEQFYIVWPLLLWLGWRMKHQLLFVTIFLISISFAANIYQINNDVATAFYSPQTRFWELLVGAILAYITIFHPKPFANFRQRFFNHQSCLGAMLIVIGLTLISRERMFPGWWAILPTVGAALIIAGGPQAWVNRIILSNKLMVWVGLISFPLYLWHWPLLSFARIICGDTPGIAVRIAAVLLAVTLAWLTYHLIESRLRFSRKLSTVIGLVFVSALVFSIGIVTYTKLGFINRPVNAPFKSAMDQKLFVLSKQSNGSCQEKMRLGLTAEEVCLASTSNPTVLFTGDSHAMSLYSAIYADRVHVGGVLVAAHSCPFYPNLVYAPAHKTTFNGNCVGIADEALRVAEKTPSIKTVVISNFAVGAESDGVFNYQLNGVTIGQDEAFIKGGGYFIGRLLAAGKRVIYVEDVPHLKHLPSDCEERTALVRPQRCEVDRAELDQSRISYIQDLAQIKIAHPNFEIFQSEPIFCNAGTCKAKDDGGYLYFDHDHLSIHGSELLLKSMQTTGLFN